MRLFYGIAAFATLVMLAPPAGAVEDDDQKAGFERFGIGAEGGMVMPGAMHVKSTSYDTSPAPFAIVYADLVAGGFLSFGVAGIFASPRVEDIGHATLLDFAATFKARISLSRTLQLRPGITLGYQLVTGGPEDVKGFDPGLTISFALRASRSTAIVLDGGFLSQPLGGSEHATVTFAPIAYAAIGLEVGR